MKYHGKRTWVFYYLTERNGEKFVIGFTDCIHPERTNLRKEQRNYWQRSDVVGTGYTNEVNRFDLVYPCSPLTVKN